MKQTAALEHDRSCGLIPLSRFRARELTHTGTTTHLFRVHLQELRCLTEIESSHNRTVGTRPNILSP